MSKAGQERGWGPVTRAHFDAERGPHGALMRAIEILGSRVAPALRGQATAAV